MVAAQQDFWGQFEVAEYDKPQYDEKYWGQFETTTQNKEALNNSLNELSEDDAYVQTEKQQTEQLANMLFTEDEINAIKNKGQIGWWEYAKNYADLSEAIPFYGTGKQIADAGKTYTIAKKLENGEEVTESDKTYMVEYLKKYTETQLRGTTWGAKGASMLIQAPAFIGEFIATAGVGATVGKGAAIAGIKAAGATATKAAVKAGSKIATSKALSTIAGRETVQTIGTKAALETTAEIAGKAAAQQAVLVPMYAVQNYNERKIADGLNITDKGNNLIYNTQKADSKANWGKSFGIGEIEILSELSGGLLGYMAGGITKGITTAAAKVGGKVATTNIARGISAVSAKVYNSLPKDVRIKLEASARLAEKLGNKINSVGEKLKQPSIGFHGTLEEIGEERLGDVLKAAFDLDANEGYSFDDLGSAIFPGWQQLLLETGIFSIVGATSLATRTVLNDLTSKGYSEKEATVITQNLSEIEKENMANEILGEVNINDDIKEQEVIKEQVKLENKIAQSEEIGYEQWLYQEAKQLAESIKNNYSDGKNKEGYKNANRDFQKQYGMSIEEALGYDGIIDDTVSTKFKNMGMEEGTTHYIAFEPNQIKSVENQGTFDENNPNIYYETEGGRSPRKDKTTETKETPVTEKAEVIEDELEIPETAADKIIRGESKWGEFYTKWVDRYTPIENLVKKAEQKVGETLDTSNDPYYQARMYAGLVESIKQQINDKTFIKENGEIKITGEGFLPIINDYVEEVKEVEPDYDKAIQDLSDYLIANRYLLDLKDREGYEATEEQKLKAIEDMTKLNLKYGDKIEDISKIADRIYSFNRRILHNLVDSGNMSQETYDKIIEDNPHHISYKRVMDDNGIGNNFYAKSKFTDAKNPVKRIKGSERDIQNIFVSTLEDVSRILDVAERNKVARSIANLKGILPEYIQDKKPAMEKRTAKVKVNYDAKMRQQLLEAIKFFGRTFENVKSIKTPTGYAYGAYSEEEKLIRKKLGTQDRTLAHEVGHMLDFALDVENKIKNNSAIMNEIRTLAADRFESTVKLQDGEYVTEESGSTEKYKNYARTNKEMIANAFDLYFTSRDYVKRVAPETAKFINNLFKGEYKFLNDIRPSSESATEEIEQDVWTPSRNKPFGNVIEYFVDGKPKFIEVTKPVMDAVEGLNSQEIDFINKFFVGSASMLRTGATITPEFAIRNFIRDQESAVIYIKNYNPFIDGVRGLMNVLGKKVTGKNKTYDEWVKAGGAFGSYMELNEKSVNKALKDFVGEGSKMRNIFSYANPIKLAEDFSSIFEQATRLGMYTRSKMNGATAMEAALESREGTLDFGRSGKLGRKYNRVLPFFNAGIQGVDKMVRTFRDHPYLSSIKAIATITLPQIALTGYYLYAAPDDDREEYLNIPQYQKDFFYCFKIGENWIRIPKDFTLGYVFGSIPERFITWTYQNKKPEGKDLWDITRTLFGSVSPINNPTDVLPPILRTLIENVANYDFFRGQRIYPEYMNSLEPSMRVNKFNSETSKILGEKLNMSPAKIDHAINSLLGTSGKYLTDAGDLMINSVREFNGEETNEKVKTLADAPFLRGFVLRDPVGYQTVSVNEFFDNFKKVSEKYSSYKKLIKNGDREAAKNYKEKYSLELRAYKHINDAKKQISDIGNKMDKIYSNKNLTNKEKQELLKPLSKKISDIAFDANVWYGEFIKE